ncbi:MAG: mannose/fructose/sorbose family PTS transporter subunit IIC [Enterobacteriaceae bacterium]
MHFTASQIVLFFLFFSFVGIDSMLDEFQVHRPIIACTIMGFILGDIKTGVIIGGTLEMIVLGWMNVGAAISPDTALSSIFSTLLVIVNKQNIGIAIALSIPVSALGQILNIFVRTVSVFFQHKSDKFAKYGNLKAINFMHISAIILHALKVLIPSIFLIFYSNFNIINNILNKIPNFVVNGLNISSGIVVIVGYAMVINMMKTKELIPFFYLSFIIAGFINFNLLAFGVIGAIIAIIYLQLHPKYNNVIDNNKKINKEIDDEL